MRKSTAFNLTVRLATADKGSNIFTHADSVIDAIDDALRRCGYSPELFDLVQNLDGTYFASLKSSGLPMLAIDVNSVFFNN